jgi:hypothetical protein
MARMTCYKTNEGKFIGQGVLIQKVLKGRKVLVALANRITETDIVSFDGLSPVWSARWYENADCLTNEQIRSKIRRKG